MIKKIVVILLVGLTFSCHAHAQEEPRLKPDTIWIVFEQDGHQWMVGALKEYARITNNHPSPLSHDLGLDTVVKVQNGSRDETLVFWSCCTTNIWISEQYTGTVTIGSHIFQVSDLLKGHIP